jgi:hypothetical protein
MFESVNTFADDGLNWPMIKLKEYAFSKDINVKTYDVIEDKTIIDAFVFLDMPRLDDTVFKLALKSNKPKYLIVLESKICAKPKSHDKENYKYFDKVFTWDDEVVDGGKYIKLCYSFKIPDNLNIVDIKKEKLCTLISANKYTAHALELYTERIKAIKWFEKNHLEDFDLYGYEWDLYLFKGIFAKLNRFKFLRKLLPGQYHSYKGSISSKKEVMKKYKFAICYENAKDSKGYITEKIYDCFFSGCVPVYLGASNVTDYIPENTFIDKRKYENYESLYQLMKHMTASEYAGYLQNIAGFIKSDRFNQFSADHYAQLIINTISTDLSK